MSTGAAIPLGLHSVPDSPVPGLAVAERRVASPLATIICVHGGLDRGGSFARLARRTEAFDLIAYDRRGYQGSRSLQPLSLENDTDDLLSIARRESSTGPVIFFGHSFGGVVTFKAALREPSLVQLVVNYESPLPWVLHREIGRSALSTDAADEAERFFRRMVSDNAWERLSEHERQSRRLDGPALLSDLRQLRSGEPLFDLAELATPALYVHGDTNIPEYYRALCAVLESINPLITTREMKKAGHGAHLSNPDQLASLIFQTWEQLCESA
jgi:pimeloyl-ACP methyl ester carboxylesterase